MGVIAHRSPRLEHYRSSEAAAVRTQAVGREDHPFDLLLSALVRAGGRVHQQSENRARLRCPTHADSKPSLVLTRESHTVLLKCFGGCRSADIIRAAGLRWSDLFVKGSFPIAKPAIEATYDYFDRSGVLIAQKVRMRPKAFRWRRPDPNMNGTWLWGLAGATPGLYGLTTLAAVPRAYCVEGEKAVDLFWSLEMPAFCPPSGASSWRSEWSRDLQGAGCAELIVLPDADSPGASHAERVAQACRNLVEPLPVKIVPLPGLANGCDAFDWLQSHSPADLVSLALEAPYWEPGASERERLARRRELTRIRVARWRAKNSGSCNAANVRGVGNAGSAVTQGERTSCINTGP
jgi:hypothetical protein